MALIANDRLTLVNAAKRRDPDGSMASVAELLSRSDTIIQDGVFVEANGEHFHRTTYRTGLPSGTWRPFNRGIQPTKSETSQVTDVMGMLDNMSFIDTKLLSLQRDPIGFRASEDAAFIQAFGQDMAAQAFYGVNQTAVPEEGFLGIHKRFDSAGASNARNIRQTLNDGADSTSIYFITWSEQTCHFIYPQGSSAGLEVDDLGVELVNDDQATPGQYRAARTYFSWSLGMCVRDWRYCGRVAEIETTSTLSAGDWEILMSDIIQVSTAIEDRQYGPPMMYMNRGLKAQFDYNAQAKGNVNLTMGEWAGQPTMMFQDMPIRVNDAIANDEPALGA
jgi:hypothetical protein